MSSNLPLFILLFARFSGFFILSPLFTSKPLPWLIRLGLASTCALLIAPPLLALHNPISIGEPLLFVFKVIQEVVIGYLLGFLVSILFEAASFAGQFIGTLTGFSATELLDPGSNSSQPLLAYFFSLALFTLFIALDLHHPLLRLLYGSVYHLPLDGSFFNTQSILALIQATSLTFKYALNWSLFPLLVLLPLLAFFALISRFFSIFWVGYPLQQIVGLFALIGGVGLFAPLLQRAFSQILELAKTLFTY